MVDEKSTLPPPVPDEITVAPVRVTGALISIKPLLVVMLLASVNELAVIERLESVLVPPKTPPSVRVPVPEVTLSPTPPSTVLLNSIPPAEAPEFKVTVPVANVTGSEIVMVPPAPWAPSPAPDPPEVLIVVSFNVITALLVLRVTVPPAPPALLEPLPALPVVVISAPEPKVITPESFVSKETFPPAKPTDEEAVPPEVIKSPLIVMSASVAPPPSGFWEAVSIVIVPPASPASPVVLIVDPALKVKEPASSPLAKTALPWVLEPWTVKLPPLVVIEALFEPSPIIISPSACKSTFKLLVVEISALIVISLAAVSVIERPSWVVVVLTISVLTVMLPSWLPLELWVLIITLLPSDKVVTIVEAFTWALSAVGEKSWAMSGPPDDVVVIVMFLGSNNHVPAPLPEASTNPETWRLSLLEVSTKPPSPLTDPLAVIDPAKLV